MTVYTRTVQGEPVTIHAPNTDSDLDGFLEFTASETLFGLDVESTAVEDRGPRQWAEDWHLRLVQFGTATEAWVLRPDLPGHVFQARALLSDPTKHFVSHSAYDVFGVWVGFGIALGQRAVDTLLLAQLLEPGELNDHALKSLTARYIDNGLVEGEDRLHAEFNRLVPKGSGIARNSKRAWAYGFTNIPLDNETYQVYAGLDAIYVRRLWDLLVAATSDYPALVAMESWLAAQTVGVTLRGIRIDRERVTENLAVVAEQIDAARARLEATFGFPALSPKRIDWLSDRGVEFHYLTETGRPSLDKDALPDLLARYGDDPEVGPVLRDTQVLSQKSNLKANLASFLDYADADGRVHPEIKTLRARTARMSVKAPALQTLKKADPLLRGAFLADPGCVLIGADFRAVELRVGAALSNEVNMIPAIMRGEDLHGNTAKLIYGPEFTPEQRSYSKVANFLTAYGGGWQALATSTGIPDEQAQDVITRFRKAYPSLTRYGYRLSDVEGDIVTPFARRLPVDPDRPYASLNYMIQSTARDLLVEALYRFIVGYGYANTLWLAVHDELVIQVPEAEAEAAAAALEQAMTTTFKGIPIACEVTVYGERWGKGDD